MPVIELVILILTGLAFGSFFNVVISRQPVGLDLFRSSRCLDCGHDLKAWENIPLLSYIILGGKCRQCSGKIPWHHPVVELLTPLIFVSVYLKAGRSFNILFLKYLIFLAAGLILFFTDLNHKLIPDAVSIPLITAGLGFSLFQTTDLPLTPALIAGAAGFFVFLLIALAFQLILKKEALGGGDIKLITAIGLFLGLSGVIFTVLTGSVLALLILIITRHDRSREFPFGPFLISAAFLYYFTGKYFINLYLSIII